jgi:PAS domain S-box-containing protein
MWNRWMRRGGQRAGDAPRAAAGADVLRAEMEREHQALRAELQRTAEALRVCEQRYALAVRGAHDGLWEWDLSGDRMSVSPRWQHLFGLQGEGDSMRLAQWRERLHPADRQAAVQALQQHLDGHTERYEHPHRMLHADGRYRWVLSRGTAVRRASGSPYRVVGLDTDITRIKRVEGIVEAIADGTASQSGERFFRALVMHFAQALHVDCAFITECTDRPPTRARTLAYWRCGAFDADFEYELAGTPCETVIAEGRTRFYPQGLAAMFPCEENQEGYLGLPIFARDGFVIGHLAFVHGERLHDDMLLESVYRIFTARAGVEIELGRALRQLEAAEAALA